MKRKQITFFAEKSLGSFSLSIEVNILFLLSNNITSIFTSFSHILGDLGLEIELKNWIGNLACFIMKKGDRDKERPVTCHARQSTSRKEDT